jgi:hypothetical protein
MSKGGRNNNQMQWMPQIQQQNSNTNTNSSTNQQQNSQTNQTGATNSLGMNVNSGGSYGTSLNQIPVWLENASRAGVSNAANILAQPVEAYGGQLTPGLTNDQQAAGNMIRNSVGAYQPYFDNAAALTQASTGAGPQVRAQTFRNGLSGAINDYMNPYIDNVVNSVSNISQRNLDKALTQTADQALAARAFGGSRHGVQEGVATAQNNQNTNDMIANLLNSGYNQATGLMGQDIQNNLAAQGQNQGAYQNWMNRLSGAGSQMANLGTANRAANVADVNNLLSYGGLDQQTQGAQQQAGYNEWLRQQNMPLQRQQLYNSTVSTAPHSTAQTTANNQYSTGLQSNDAYTQANSNTNANLQSNTTGNTNTNSTGLNLAQQQQATSNPLMGGLGGALAGAKLGSIVPGIGTGIGAIGGGLLGMFQ